MAGGLLQGLWAIYANSEHSQAEYLRAGVVQGMNSFVMSFVITFFMEWIVVLYDRIHPVVLRFAAALASAFLFMVTIHYGSNWIFGTPDILETIAPAIIIGTIYCSSYLLARLGLVSRRARKG